MSGTAIMSPSAGDRSNDAAKPAKPAPSLMVPAMADRGTNLDLGKVVWCVCMGGLEFLYYMDQHCSSNFECASSACARRLLFDMHSGINPTPRVARMCDVGTNMIEINHTNGKIYLLVSFTS